jgi:alkylated DNA repair dioxygenase AlkB
MLNPSYHKEFFEKFIKEESPENTLGKYFSNLFDSLLLDLEWLEETPNRKEYMMADQVIEYTYGSFAGDRKYTSKPFHPGVKKVMEWLNAEGNSYNVCFLNRYDGQHQSLHWHADNFAQMEKNHGIAVVSLGDKREIWWKEKTFKGPIPSENRQLLAHGSLFVMPPFFQESHLHRIPKHDKPCLPRVSLTYRKFI